MIELLAILTLFAAGALMFMRQSRLPEVKPLTRLVEWCVIALAVLEVVF
jgi:hypothetical protein